MKKVLVILFLVFASCSLPQVSQPVKNYGLNTIEDAMIHIKEVETKNPLLVIVGKSKYASDIRVHALGKITSQTKIIIFQTISGKLEKLELDYDKIKVIDNLAVKGVVVTFIDTETSRYCEEISVILYELHDNKELQENKQKNKLVL